MLQRIRNRTFTVFLTVIESLLFALINGLSFLNKSIYAFPAIFRGKGNGKTIHFHGYACRKVHIEAGIDAFLDECQGRFWS